MRCPGCNSNDIYAFKIHEDGRGTRCNECDAHWIGELFTDKELDEAIRKFTTELEGLEDGKMSHIIV